MSSCTSIRKRKSWVSATTKNSSGKSITKKIDIIRWKPQGIWNTGIVLIKRKMAIWRWSWSLENCGLGPRIYGWGRLRRSKVSRTMVLSHGCKIKNKTRQSRPKTGTQPSELRNPLLTIFKHFWNDFLPYHSNQVLDLRSQLRPFVLDVFTNNVHGHCAKTTLIVLLRPVGQPYPTLESIHSSYSYSFFLQLSWHHCHCHGQPRELILILQLKLLTGLAYFPSVDRSRVKKNHVSSLTLN